MGLFFTPEFLIYLALSVMVSVFGVNRRMGFWGYLFASILLTPVLGLLLVIISSKKEDGARAA